MQYKFDNLKSSFIKQIAFKNSGLNNGQIIILMKNNNKYLYKDVDIQTASIISTDILKNMSVGKLYNAKIKGKFFCDKIG